MALPMSAATGPSAEDFWTPTMAPWDRRQTDSEGTERSRSAPTDGQPRRATQA